MTDPSSIAVADLLQHGEWMRQLARRLVREATAADDVVQDAWVSALRKPPASRVNLKAWLGEVVRSSARQRVRGNRRRTHHERKAADAPRTADASDDVVARFETQRQVADLVLALEEPDRTILLLRFYEGLDSRQIAQRTEMNANTVRWRLGRALARLREQLDRSHGGDGHSWCLALTPFLRRGAAAAGSVTGASVISLLSGTLLMKIVLTSVAAGLVALGIVTLSHMGLLPFGGSMPSSDPIAVTFVPLATDDEKAEGGALQPERSLVLDDVATSQDTGTRPDPALAGGVFHGRVVDEAGRSVPGATIISSHSKASAAGDGRFRLPIPQWSPRGDIQGTIAARGFATRDFEAAWNGLSDVALGDLVLSPGGDVRGRVVDARGAIVPGARVALVEHAPHSMDFRRWRRDTADGDAGRNAIDCDPAGDFALSGLPIGFVRLVASAPDHLGTLSSPVEVRAGMESSGAVLVLESMLPEDLIDGVVLEPDGSRATNAELGYNYRSFMGSGSGSLSIRKDGTFRMVIKIQTSWNLRATDRHGRFGDAVLEDVEPGTRGLVLQLTELRHLSLTVIAPGASGVNIDVFNAEHTHHHGSQFAENQAEGPISVRVPGGDFLVAVHAEGFDREVLGPFGEGAAPETLQCTLTPLPGVRGTVMSADGPVAGADVQLYPVARSWTEHNGFPVHLDPSAPANARSDEDGVFSATLREAGRFFVRASHPDFAPAELGPFDIDPHAGLADLNAHLTAGGILEGQVLPASGKRAAGTIVGISRGDSHAETQRVGEDGRFRFERLVPGPWRVQQCEEEIFEGRSSTTQEGGRAVARLRDNCSVVEGEVTWFDLDLSRGNACELRGQFRWRGEDMTGWTATLLAVHGNMARDASRTSLSPAGEFVLRGREPGQYRIRMERFGEGDTGVQVFAELTLKSGRNDWQRDLQSATLTLTDIPPLSANPTQRTMNLVVWSRDELTAIGWVNADEAGRCELARVPAGTLRLVRRDPAQIALEETMPAAWPAFATVTLAAGEHRVVSFNQ